MSSDNIQVIKTKILTLQKKQLCNEFRFKKYLLKVIETNNEKQINKFHNFADPSIEDIIKVNREVYLKTLQNYKNLI